MLYHDIQSSGLDYSNFSQDGTTPLETWGFNSEAYDKICTYMHICIEKEKKRERETEKETLGHVHVHRHRHVYVGEVQEHHFSPVSHFFRPVSVSRTSTPMARHGRSLWKYQNPPRVGFSECDNWNINRNRDSNQTG